MMTKWTAEGIFDVALCEEIETLIKNRKTKGYRKMKETEKFIEDARRMVRDRSKLLESREEVSEGEESSFDEAEAMEAKIGRKIKETEKFIEDASRMVRDRSKLLETREELSEGEESSFDEGTWEQGREKEKEDLEQWLHNSQF